MLPNVFHGAYFITFANSGWYTFMGHPRQLKPNSIRNVQIKIQIVGTHETLEIRIVIGFQAFDFQLNLTLLDFIEINE